MKSEKYKIVLFIDTLRDKYKPVFFILKFNTGDPFPNISNKHLWADVHVA
jgi:hypothetical protein